METSKQDIFRKGYRDLDPSEAKAIGDIKDQASALLSTIQLQPVNAGPSEKARALSLAKTKLEESVMWAVKAITG